MLEFRCRQMLVHDKPLSHGEKLKEPFIVASSRDNLSYLPPKHIGLADEVAI